MPKVNPWLSAKLKEVSLGNPETLSLIVQVEIAKMESVKLELTKIADVSVVSQSFDYINVTAPAEAISAIEKIDGVVIVHYNMPVKQVSQPFPIPFWMSDPLLGEIKLDTVVMPTGFTPELFLPLNPLRLSTIIMYKYVPTAQTKDALIDVTTELTGKGVKVAVLDTGILNTHPQIGMRAKELGTTLFPFPVDDNGHGHWCCSTIMGDPWAGIFGLGDGIAPGVDLTSIKVLGFGVGTGTVMGVIEGMEKAYLQGAKIISMSLGSEECQGGCYEEDGGPCPECRIIKKLSDLGVIFSIAAGNSGPDENTIGCPACSPSGIAVAAVSFTDEQTSWFSSRGPQNKANIGKMRLDDTTIKPDIASYGGGRAEKEDKPDEILYNGCVALLDGMNSGIKHGMEGLKGTSMACPAFTGLLALAIERGIVKNVSDVKSLLSVKGHRKSKADGWGLCKLSWLV